ncbi:hypothetical protein D3OALGA1CA_4377 [Olavius algarvensis associated proteobacterium Delta 3]|nr:hypothetical protein D3OALGA1CA_4377 [Olavius algarvensis associated proteobacterium Delta 3]
MLLDSRIHGFKIQDAGYKIQVAGIWIEGVRDSGVGCQDWLLEGNDSGFKIQAAGLAGHALNARSSYPGS